MNNNLSRTTEIISDMIYEEYLLQWANHLGFKHKNYKNIRDRSANIGTIVHNLIESKINGIDKQYKISISNKKEIVYGYHSFLLWWKNLNAYHNVEIIGTEIAFETEEYRGTCDIILKIDDKIYIGDFKTSNHLSYRYIIQLGAYIQGIEKYKNIKADGAFILKLNKYSLDYEMKHYDFTINESHKQFFEEAIETFNILIRGYNCKKNIKKKWKEVNSYEEII